MLPAHSTRRHPQQQTSQQRTVRVVSGRTKFPWCLCDYFFGVLGEIIRRRDLGQYPGDDLIRQALKGLMNTSFQISKLRRMVPQLGDPLLLLILQLLLHLPQRFVNVFDHGTIRRLNTHVHTPPAIHVVQLARCLRKAYSIHGYSRWPYFGNRPGPNIDGTAPSTR